MGAGVVGRSGEGDRDAVSLRFPRPLVVLSSPPPISFHAASRNEGRRGTCDARRCLHREKDVFWHRRRAGSADHLYYLVQRLCHQRPHGEEGGKSAQAVGVLRPSPLPITGPFRASWRGWSRRAVVRRARSRCRSRRWAHDPALHDAGHAERGLWVSRADLFQGRWTTR